MGLGGRAVSVMALATLLQDMGLMLMGGREQDFRMAVEATPLEAKATTTTQPVTLSAIDGQGRVLHINGEFGGGSVSHEEANLLVSCLPDQGQRVFAGSGHGGGAEHIGKRFLGRDSLTVKFQVSAGSGSKDADLTLG